MSKSKTFEINWFAAAGSALGAVSSAVLLSTFGVAGTLIGAALGSLVITVGGSIYTQSLQKTKAHVDTRRGMRRSTRTEAANAGDGPVPTSGATAVLTPETPRKSPSETLRGLPWKHIIFLAVGLFVATMAIILAFELSTGRPVSSFTGGSSETRTGTSVSGLTASGGNSSDSDKAVEPVVEKSPAPVPSAEGSTPGNQPTEGVPTEGAPTPDPTTAAPTPAGNPADPQASPEPSVQPPAVDPSADPPAVVAPADPPAVVAPPVEPPAAAGPPAQPGASDG
ncbi:MAG: hypothetical protein ABIS84_01260 [Arachnia sp.]